MAGVLDSAEASSSGAGTRKAGGYQAVAESGDEEATQKQLPIQTVDVPGHNELFNEDNVSIEGSAFPVPFNGNPH